MNRGKEICNELKAVRRSIAEENGITMETPECLHQGPCPGTCPRCEQELRQLESALADRLRMGKVATVAGVALALASPAVAQTQDSVQPVPPQHVRQTSECRLSGTVVDDITGEPLPFAGLYFRRSGSRSDTAQVKTTDFDGHFAIMLPAGHYIVETRTVGYLREEHEVEVAGATLQLDTIRLIRSATRLDEFSIVENRLSGIIESDLDTLPAQPEPLVALKPAKPVKVRGTILDEKTKEPLPFIYVVFKQEGTQVLVAVTDFDGMFKLELPEGEYDVDLMSVGYYRKSIKVTITKASRNLGEILLTPSATLSEGVVVIEPYVQPLIEIGPNGTSQTLEIEGVKVNVR